jgi:hypothetical protein
VFGGLGWYYGAQFTLDGWIVWLNQILPRFRVPYTIPPVPVSWWFTMVLIIGVGLVYTRVEINPPVRYRGTLSVHDLLEISNYRIKAWQVCAIWLVIVGTDIASTFTGVVNPHTDGWVVSLGAHLGDWRSYLVAAVVTFGPERLIVWSWKQLFGSF